MSMREKLAQLRAQQQAATQPLETKKEEPKEETQEVSQDEAKPKPGASILARLREIGARKEINAENPPAEEPPVEEPPIAESPAEEPTTEEPEVREEDPNEGKTQCPTCDKWFKVIAKHRCTMAPKIEESTEETKEELEEEATEKSTEESTEKEVKNIPENIPVEKEKTPKEEKPVRKDFTLLIDCVPTDAKIGGFNIIHASRLCMPVKEAICKEHGVEHYKSVQYGAGPGLLATRLERMLKEGIAIDFVYLDSRDIDSPAIVDVLCEYARLVLRAIR